MRVCAHKKDETHIDIEESMLEPYGFVLNYAAKKYKSHRRISEDALHRNKLI